MDDLISRQLAIEAAECIVEHHAITPYKTMAAAMDHLKRILNGMPSAVPEIIRCKDCKYGEQDEDGRWFCSDLGCQMGDKDGNGFCSDAERRTNE